MEEKKYIKIKKSCLTIIVFCLIGLFAITILLILLNQDSQSKCKTEEPKQEEKKEEEKIEPKKDDEKEDNEDIDINDLSDNCSWDYTGEDKDEKTIKFNNKIVTISNYGTIKYKYDLDKMEYFQPYEAYSSGNILIIQGSYSGGVPAMIFFDNDLKQLKTNNEHYVIQPKNVDNKSYFSNNVMEVKFINGNYHYEGSLLCLHDICIEGNFGNDCDGWDGYIGKFSNEFKKYKDEIMEGEAKLTYDGTKLNFTITKKVTVWDKYGKDIESNSKNYCISVKK